MFWGFNISPVMARVMAGAEFVTRHSSLVIRHSLVTRRLRWGGYNKDTSSVGATIVPVIGVSGISMESTQHNWIAHFMWGIADGVLRDAYVRGKYHGIIRPMTVSGHEVLPYPPMSGTKVIRQKSVTRFHSPVTSPSRRRCARWWRFGPILGRWRRRRKDCWMRY